jgi:excisionase family DNA binding protein
MVGRYLTTAEAASRLGLAVRTVRWACETGRMTAERVGRDWLIEESAILWYELSYRSLENQKSRKRRMAED